MKHLRPNAVALVIGLLSVAAYLPYAPVRMADFRAFYCAGRSIDAHADPYRLHPLRECERDAIAPGVPADGDDATVPAPLPGYVLAGFALLAALPFGPAALLWFAASLAALAGSVALLRRVLELPAATIAIAIVLPAAIVALPLGQLAPFVGFGVAACAAGLASARWRLAALGALATAADPAIALVLCATLLLAAPATRATILWGTAALAALALLTLGIDTNLEYVRVVLHAHAAGNVAERSQFSATHFAWVAGLRTPAALAAGSLWYAGAALTGVWLALRLRKRFGVTALALIPPAFAVFGGVYVHYSQIVLALPAFLLMLRDNSPRFAWLPAAIFVLAVPWIALAGFPPFAFALVALALAYGRDLPGYRGGLRLGLASSALLVVLFGFALTNVSRPASAAFHPDGGRDVLAETAWSRYIGWRDPRPNRLFLVLELPTVAAFSVCLAGLAFTGVRGAKPARVRLNPGAESPMDFV